MKRILVTILSILYMAGATGATVHVHYCMGKFMGAGFVHKDEDKCGKCGMKKSISKGCCKDEHKTFKTSDHQLSKASFYFSHNQTASVCFAHYSFYLQSFYQGSVKNVGQANSPPSVWRTYPIYIHVQNFRI